MTKSKSSSKTSTPTARPRGAFSTVKETDKTITVGSATWDKLHRDRLDYEHRTLLEQAIKAYRLNPLARRIVKMYRYFALGTNVSIELKKNKSDWLKRLLPGNAIYRTNRFINAFWHHFVNQMDEQLPEWFDERTLSGNLFVLFTVDQSGMPLVRALPSEFITKIDLKDNDYRQETSYSTGQVDEQTWPAYNPDLLNAEEIKPFIRHYVINRPVGSSLGESDLYPILPWIARYTGWLENRATLNYWRQIFVWVLKGKFKSETERKARQKEIEANPPKPGAILVGDESETWETIAPKLDSFQANADGLAIKKQIAAGAGFPLHFLAEPESSTRTTAEAAGTPTYKNFHDYQQSFFNIIRDVLTIACAIRRTYDSDILARPEFEVHGQDISERDNPALALAFSRAVEATAELYDRKMIDTKEFLRLVYGFGGQVFDETQQVKEGMRRSLSNKSNNRQTRNTPSTPPPSQPDPESGDEPADETQE